MSWRRVLLAAVAALPLLGCAADAPTPSGRPTAAAPEVDSRLRSLGSGVVDIALDPGQVRDLDPLNLAINMGVTPPPCAGFVMLFTWQVKQPDPAGDARVSFVAERMGGRFEVGPPASSGEASIGCALLEAVNQSAVPIVVQLHLVVATPKR